MQVSTEKGKLQGRLDEIEKQKNGLQTRVDELQKDVRNLETEASTKTRDHEDEVRRLKAIVGDKEAQITQLRTEKSDLDASCTDLRSQINEKDEQIAEHIAEWKAWARAIVRHVLSGHEEALYSVNEHKFRISKCLVTSFEVPRDLALLQLADFEIRSDPNLDLLDMWACMLEGRLPPFSMVNLVVQALMADAGEMRIRFSSESVAAFIHDGLTHLGDSIDLAHPIHQLSYLLLKDTLLRLRGDVNLPAPAIAPNTIITQALAQIVASPASRQDANPYLPLIRAVQQLKTGFTVDDITFVMQEPHLLVIEDARLTILDPTQYQITLTEGTHRLYFNLRLRMYSVSVDLKSRQMRLSFNQDFAEAFERMKDGNKEFEWQDSEEDGNGEETDA